MSCSNQAHGIQGGMVLEGSVTESMDHSKELPFPFNAGSFHTQVLTFNPKPKPKSSSAAASVAPIVALSDAMVVDGDITSLPAPRVKEYSTRNLSRSPPENRPLPKLSRRARRARNRTFTLHEALVINSTVWKGPFIHVPSAVLPVDHGAHAHELTHIVRTKMREGGENIGKRAFDISWDLTGYFLQFRSTKNGWRQCKKVQQMVNGTSFRGVSLQLVLYQALRRSERIRSVQTVEPVVDADIKVEDDVRATTEAEPSGDTVMEDYDWEDGSCL